MRWDRMDALNLVRNLCLCLPGYIYLIGPEKSTQD
jgi:hypothetical protein